MTTIEDKFHQLGNSIINLVGTRASRNIDNLSSVGRANIENIISNGTDYFVTNTTISSLDTTDKTIIGAINELAGAGYITGITSSDVTTALGYTPYNGATNPNGYTSNVGTVTKVNNETPDANGNVTLSIPSIANLADKDLSNLSSTGNTKFQAPLVSGTNIKTINNNSILGNGNLSIDSLPTQTGNSGKFLTTDGSAASWAAVDALPSQSGNNGKFLTTNGTTASWSSVSIPTESTVSGWGFTKNTGTVTSVNNISPVNGNVTLSIPSVEAYTASEVQTLWSSI